MELEELDWETRKLMTMCRAQHLKADVDRLYLQKSERERPNRARTMRAGRSA